MKRYRFETVAEYLNRGGSIQKFKASTALRASFSKGVQNRESALRRFERWRLG